MNSLRLTRLAALPVILIPLVILLVVNELRREPEAEQTQLRTPAEADYYMRGAEVSAMNDAGQLSYRVTAATVLHFPDDTVKLDKVEVDYLDGPWELVAQSGLMTPGAVRLDLHGSVSMSGHLQSGDDIKLDTEKMSVYFDERRIDTDAPVHMESGHITAQAIGMRTDLDGKELALASEVRVIYAP